MVERPRSAASANRRRPAKARAFVAALARIDPTARRTCGAAQELAAAVPGCPDGLILPRSITGGRRRSTRLAHPARGRFAFWRCAGAQQAIRWPRLVFGSGPPHLYKGALTSCFATQGALPLGAIGQGPPGEWASALGDLSLQHEADCAGERAERRRLGGLSRRRMPDQRTRRASRMTSRGAMGSSIPRSSCRRA